MFKKRLDNIVQGTSSKLMQHAYWYLLAKMQIQPTTRIYKLERTMNDPATRGRPKTYAYLELKLIICIYSGRARPFASSEIFRAVKHISWS